MFIVIYFCLAFSSSFKNDRYEFLKIKCVCVKEVDLVPSTPTLVFSTQFSEGFLNPSSPRQTHGALLTHFSPITLSPLLASHARARTAPSL